MSKGKPYPEENPKSQENQLKQTPADDGQLSDEDLANVSGGAKKAAPAAVPAAPAPMM
jgi:bacteriocin-like protein